MRRGEDEIRDDALKLEESTICWLLYTGISEYAHDDAGHATMAMTERHIETDQRERIYPGKKNRVKVFE
jgi:hypothetical protein